jgi:hypothetical protein
MENNLSIHVQMFNDRVRAMNQTQRRELTLTAVEARNLHADIFELLARITELANQESTASDTVTVVMDGGGFK